MTRKFQLLFPVFMFACAAAPLGAQGSRVTTGPTVAKAAVGVRASKAAPTTPAALPRRTENSKNMAMMVVGGAALIVGAIIGDTPGTIIMVGGAGVGLYGLYKYLE